MVGAFGRAGYRAWNKNRERAGCEAQRIDVAHLADVGPLPEDLLQRGGADVAGAALAERIRTLRPLMLAKG